MRFHTGLRACTEGIHMFDELRKKLSNAVKGFIKKEERTEKEELGEHEASEPKKSQKPIEEQVHEAGKEENKHAELQKEIPKERKKPEGHQQKNEDIIRLSLKTKIKSAFLGTVKLNEKEIDEFLDTLRISMLESDVSYGTAEQFIDALHSDLRERRIDSKKIKEEVTESVRESLFSVLQKGKGIDVDEFVASRKETKGSPVKILFLGPNGAGKTTTIAKISHHFKKNGVGNVLSASDTFRAAAIEQIEHHAKRIGVPIVKSSYGADPASIAFDTIAYARAHNIDLVLIDSAGRQETNKSLISEVQKMVRVAKPDITIFVGESTSGNQISEQIKEFNKFVKIDGIILTKLDCDAKGGGALSISHSTGIPILFFGTGESYEALVPYNPNYIVDAILPSAE